MTIIKIFRLFTRPSINVSLVIWILVNWNLFGIWDLVIGIFIQLEPQVEQLVEEQLPQEEPAALLNFPPLEKAKADIIRLTLLLLHSGQTIF